jgi:protein-S-isoprenylcysteine O-methyltransferase Ste14
MWKIILFLLLSLPILFVSRASLRVPRSHGFYRFFAWEAILGLFLLNVDFWFRDPFHWHQIISWILLFASFIPLGFGIKELRARGKPAEDREGDPALMAFEKTTTLVTTGIYHYIRHPLYSSLLILVWGIFLKHPSWAGGLVLALAIGFLIPTAKADEAECQKFFGATYLEYMGHTKMFIPFLL